MGSESAPIGVIRGSFLRWIRFATVRWRTMSYAPVIEVGTG
jgi:hypothetical protein